MWKKRLIWIGILVLVAAGGGTWFRIRQIRANNAVHYDTATIERGQIVAKVTASGTLSPIVTVQVGSQVSGTIAALYADFNSTVTKGELIAKIDPRLFDAAVQQSRANLVAAEGNLAKAKAQAEDAERQAQRNSVLLSRRLIAQADFDTARSTADADKAAVDAAVGAVSQAQAQLHQVEVNLAYTDITSPTNGTVISRSVDVGQTVAASLQAPTLFMIAKDLREMQVDTSVTEADIGKIEVGMKTTFSVDAYPTEKFVGTVRQVRNSPQTVQNVVTYDAVIDVKNPELKLKPGMTANCTFVYAERDAALRVPNAAMRFVPPRALLARLNPGGGRGGRPGGRFRRGGDGGGQGSDGAAASPAADGGEAPAGRAPSGFAGGLNLRGHGPATQPRPSNQRTVWVLRDNRPYPVQVRIGISDGSLTEVLEGGAPEAGPRPDAAPRPEGTASPEAGPRPPGAPGQEGGPRRWGGRRQGGGPRPGGGAKPGAGAQQEAGLKEGDVVITDVTLGAEQRPQAPGGALPRGGRVF